MKRPCRVRFCKNPAVKGAYYCEIHLEKHISERRKKDLEYKRNRDDKDIQALYKTRRWKELKEKYLSSHKICEVCNRNEARIVHHKIPVKEGGEFFEISNLQAVCNSCHEKLHLRAVVRGEKSS